MNSTELREEIGRAICQVDEQNGAAPWDWHDTKGKARYYECADALLPLLSAARDEGAQQMREACRKIAMDLAKKCDRDTRGDHQAAILWDAYHAMGQARLPTPPSL